MINRTADVGDCTRRPTEQHTAVNIEGACIHGKNTFGHPAGVCGACVFYQKRKHLAQEPKHTEG